MKYWKTALSIFALSASLALGEDFKTTKGKEYKNATVSRVEPDGIVLRTKTGISKLYFIELPKDVQERFQPSPDKTVAAQRELGPIKLTSSAQAENPIVVLVSFIAGALIIAGVVLAIVFRHFR